MPQAQQDYTINRRTKKRVKIQKVLREYMQGDVKGVAQKNAEHEVLLYQYNIRIKDNTEFIRRQWREHFMTTVPARKASLAGAL